MAGCAVTNSEAFRDRLRRDPFDQEALAGLGVALLAEGRPAQAAAILSTVDGQDVLTDLGEALLQAGLRTDAEARLREALAINPGQVRAAVALVSLLRGDDRFGEAQPLARHAYSLDPAKAAEALGGVLIDRGNLAYRANDPETAEALYRDAVTVLPNYAGAQTNLGNALVHQLRFPEAEAAYRTALASDPGHDGTWFAASLARLLQGDAQEGFRLYEHRRGMAEMAANYNRRPDLPAWRFGEDLAGRRVLVAAEQGAGDVIQFARYVPALARIAATVTLEAPWPIAGLFGDLGIPVIPLEGKADCDIQIPLMSLPLLLGPDAGATPPYLHPIEEQVWRWQAWLDRSPPGRRIGLVCSGDPRHPRDVERSFPLAAYAPLFDLPNVTFVLVQTELREADWDTLDDADNLRFPGAALTDWADTAALLSQLDLLITIDTATAHLAGALGLPVWTLLPFCPDWRWGLGRDDCPWYPSMRLYRQTERGAWNEVIERVRNDLRTP
jgi:tetratricopeptide (TPR) repeat protein